MTTTEDLKSQIQKLDDIDWHSTMPNPFARSTSYLISLEDLAKYYNISSFETQSTSTTTPTTTAAMVTGLTDLTAEEQLYYWPMLLLIFPLITVFGNVLVVLSVIRETNLHTATNYFIVSLAAADIGLALVVMPLASWVEANAGRWRYGSIFCDIFIMFDVMLCTASILNLAAISMDRYVAVTKPIFYAQHSKNIRVSLTIAFTWVLSFIIALPIACGLNNVPHRVLEVCTMYTPEYIIGSSIGSFYIPCPIMIILYYRVFRAIRERTKRSTHISITKFGQPKSHTFHEHRTTNCSTAIVNRDDLPTSSPFMPKTETLTETNSSTSDHHDKLNQSLMYQNVTFDSDSPHDSKSYHDGLIDFEPMKQQNVNSKSVQNMNINLDRNDQTDPVEFTNMDDFRKHLRERIKRAKRSSLSILTPNFSGLSSKNVYGLTIVDSNNRNRSRGGGGVGGVHLWNSSRLKYRSNFAGPNGCTMRSLKSYIHGTFNNKSKQHSCTSTQKNSLESNNPKVCSYNGSANKANSKENLSARREKKATKTLAIVLGVFLFCWMPFFTVNIANAFCFKISSLKHTPICNMPDTVTTVCVWLGYINSFLNPILYTIFNNEFRKAFKKLLHCT